MARLHCRLEASLLVAAMLGVSSEVWAAGESPFGISMQEEHVALLGLVGANLVNLSTGVVNTYYIAKGEQGPTTAIVSYVAGAVGVVGGGIGYSSPHASLQIMGGITIGVSLANMALATWNLTQTRAEERRIALAPTSVPDAAGNASPGVAVAGAF